MIYREADSGSRRAERMESMRFTIAHEAGNQIRIRDARGAMSPACAEALERALNSIPATEKVTLYRATGGVRLTYTGDRQSYLAALRALDPEARKVRKDTSPQPVLVEDLTEKEIRKLPPELKARLRKHILVESCADMFLPTPLAAAYHVYQLVTLRNM